MFSSIGMFVYPCSFLTGAATGERERERERETNVGVLIHHQGSICLDSDSDV